MTAVAHRCEGTDRGVPIQNCHLCAEEKAKRLEQLLLRVDTVVEEADGRYITNSCMLVQLMTLSAAMYQGYRVLDSITYREHKDYWNLESVVANMMEFVVLLGGCDRVSRRCPYDAYLRVDNFMFGRHVEKQQIVSFVLLRHDVPAAGSPAVLPVTGGRGVGKKTLVAHVCDDERVRSHFATILHLKGAGLSRIADHQRPSGRTLVVVEFASDADDDDWAAFRSSVRSKGTACKVIVLGRDEKLSRLGTVKPIAMNRLPFEEYRYLFKTLALGSANPGDHPRLAAIVEEFAILLGGSLISANLIAHAMRKYPDAHFWFGKLNTARTILKLTMSRFGVHPNELFDRGRPVHLNNGQYLMSPAAPSCLIPSATSPRNVSGNNNLPKVKWDFLVDEEALAVPPRGDFELISWKSRLAPYTQYVHLVQYVPSCVHDNKSETSFSGKKRSALSV